MNRNRRLDYFMPAGAVCGVFLATATYAAEPESHDPTRFMVVLGLFALFGAFFRMLFRWRSGDVWPRRVGMIGVSVFVGWLSALFLWEQLEARPTMLMAISGATAWLGGDIVSQVVTTITGMRFRESDGK